MPNPANPWERSLTGAFTAGDNVAAAAALATLITASTDYDLIAGGDGITDEFVEFGGAAAGPFPAARWLVGINPVAGASAPDASNKGWEQTGNPQGFIWCCYAPDGGRTANAWDSALPVFSLRNTGFFKISTMTVQMDRVRMLSNAEQIRIGWGKTAAPTDWTGVLTGANWVPPTDADGESDGRVRGLQTQPNALRTDFWNIAGVFGSTAVGASLDKTCIFDPAAPNTVLAAVIAMLSGPVTPTPTAYTTSTGGEAHMSIPWITRFLSAVPGANASQLSIRAGATSGNLLPGDWRQTRMGPDRVDGLDITDPPPPGNVVSHTLSSSAIAAHDTIYFDDG